MAEQDDNEKTTTLIINDNMLPDVDKKCMVVHARQETIYPMVTLSIDGNNFNFFCDNMSGESYVTNEVVKILGLRINTKEIPTSTGGFGGSRSIVDKTVTLKLAPGCIITFNVTEKIADDVGGVSEQIYKILS